MIYVSPILGDPNMPLLSNFLKELEGGSYLSIKNQGEIMTTGQKVERRELVIMCILINPLIK
jgi:hypothetical protein